MSKNLAPTVDGRYGAPMGRASYIARDPAGTEWIPTAPDGSAIFAEDRAILALQRQRVRRFHMQWLKLDSGGYDRGGAYWGHGERIYIAQDENDHAQWSCRARDRASAIAKLREMYPNAVVIGRQS